MTREEAVQIAKDVKLGRTRSYVQAAQDLANYVLERDAVATFPALAKFRPPPPECCPEGSCELSNHHEGPHGDADNPASNGYTLVDGRWTRDNRHFLGVKK